MTDVEDELQKATEKVPSPTFDELMAKAKEADDEKSNAYRIHIQELVKNDFLYLTFTSSGRSRLEVTLKRDGLQQISALVLQILKESLLQGDPEEQYKPEKNGGNAGYA